MYAQETQRSVGVYFLDYLYSLNAILFVCRLQMPTNSLLSLSQKWFLS